MSKLENIKDKVLATLGTVIDKSADIYENAEEKAKYIAKTTKLKAGIAKDNAEVKKLYADLGSLYYCLHKDNPDEALSQLCGEIKVLLDKIELKQRELEELAAQAAEKDIIVDLTEEPAEDETPAETDAEESVPEEENE